MREESMSKMDLKGTGNDEPNPSEALCLRPKGCH